jgi:hypothetical protein
MMTTRRMIASAVATGLISASACSTQSHADPVFPDLSSYASANSSDYAVAIPNFHPHDPTNSIYFLTPDGIPCNFHSDSVECIGNIPGVAGNDKNPYTSLSTASGIKAATSTPYSNGTVQGQPIRTLPPLQSIAVAGDLCGVDNAGSTACKDYQGRGFVISQQGTRWLPHV